MAWIHRAVTHGGGPGCLVGSALALCLTACDPTATAATDPWEPQQPLPVVHGWIGRYEGRGVGKIAGEGFSVEDAELRIAFDADSVAVPSCPTCVTVTLEPWFSRANLQMNRAADAFLRYEVQGGARSLAIHRFSGAGSTANVLLVRAERWKGTGSEAELVAFGDFELERR